MDWILPALSGLLTLILVPVVGYFLKKIHDRVEESADDINLIRLQMAGLGNEFSKNIIAAFNDLCKERQSHCSVLQITRFKALELSDKINCDKMVRLESDRKEAWILQKQWNERIENTITGIKDKANGK